MMCQETYEYCPPWGHEYCPISLFGSPSTAAPSSGNQSLAPSLPPEKLVCLGTSFPAVTSGAHVTAKAGTLALTFHLGLAPYGCPERGPRNRLSPKACSDTGLQGQGFLLGWAVAVASMSGIRSKAARSLPHLTAPLPRDQKLFRDTQRSKTSSNYLSLPHAH